MSFGFQLVHARPSRTWTLLLSWLLFSLGLTLYFYASQKRHHENPEDRVMPTVSQMLHGMSDATLKPAEDDATALPDNASLRQRFFASMLWTDTVATSRPVLYGIRLLIPPRILRLPRR